MIQMSVVCERVWCVEQSWCVNEIRWKGKARDSLNNALFTASGLLEENIAVIELKSHHFLLSKCGWIVLLMFSWHS